MIQMVDWIAIGIVVAAGLIGLLLGFGKCLKIFTGGIVGIAISIVVTYFCLGVVSSWGFVQALMGKLVGAMQGANNGFVDFLLTIHIEKVILAIGLALIVQILRIIIVNVIKNIVEMENVVMRAFNKFFGMLFALAVVIMVALILFQIVAWVGGESAANFKEYLSGALHLDWVFEHNPLNALFQKIGG